MADPIVEQIRAAFKSRLAGVTVAAGYHQTLVVEPLKRHGNSAAHLTAVIEQGEEDAVGQDESAVQRDTWDQMFTCFVHISNPGDAADFDQLCNLVVADVRKAVMADDTFGGLALYAIQKSAGLFLNEAGEVAGVGVPFTVRYRHKAGDPFTP